MFINLYATGTNRLFFSVQPMDLYIQKRGETHETEKKTRKTSCTRACALVHALCEGLDGAPSVVLLFSRLRISAWPMRSHSHAAATERVLYALDNNSDNQRRPHS